MKKYRSESKENCGGLEDPGIVVFRVLSASAHATQRACTKKEQKS
jgi:hypothetical protein